MTPDESLPLESLPLSDAPPPPPKRGRGRPRKTPRPDAEAQAPDSSESAPPKQRRASQPRPRPASHAATLAVLERDLAESLTTVGMLASVMMPTTGTTFMMRAESSAALWTKQAANSPRMMAAALRFVALMRGGETLALVGAHVAAVAVDLRVVAPTSKLPNMMISDVLTVMGMTPEEQTRYAELSGAEQQSFLHECTMRQHIARAQAEAAAAGAAA